MNRDVHIHFYSQGATDMPQFGKAKPKPKPKPKPKTYVAQNLFPDGPLESIKYSTNGSNWSNIVTGGFINGINSHTYCSSVWVAIGGNSGNVGYNSTIQYSGDSSNWSNSVSGGFDVGYSISYNPISSITVAVGQGNYDPNAANYYDPNTTIQYSGDGSNWSNAYNANFSKGTGNDITNNGSNLWIAVGEATTLNNSILYSGDGSNWSNSISGGFEDGYGVSYSPIHNMMVAVGRSGNYEPNPNTTIQYSGDGSNWSNCISGGFDSFGKGIANNRSNLWVAIGQSTSPSTCIQYSGDGSNWSNSSYNGIQRNPSKIIWTGSNFLIHYNATKMLKSSTDGITWTTAIPHIPFSVTSR